MNKIYKVIYSKVRNCYVVVSELAKSHDDGHVRRSRSGCGRKAAVLTAFVLTTSLATVPVWAADSKENINNVVTIKDNQQDISVMAGSNNLNGTGNVVYGTGNTADKSGAVIVGKNSKGDKDSVIIGNDAQSNAENQIIIGHGIANGTAEGSIIIGNTNNTVDTSQSVLIGNNTKANGSGKGIVIIGNEAMADSKAAGYTDNGKYIPAGIVLGEYSYSNTRAGKEGFLSNKKGDKPSEAYTPEYWNAVWKATANPMAIGNVDTDANGKGEEHNGHGVLTRQITGVAAGTDLTDAVNVAQLQAAMAQFSGGGSGTGGDGVHYYSVFSDEQGPDSNYDNRGAKGKNSLAAGVNASAKGENAVAIGNGAKAEGKGATVIGQYAKATGDYATAFGGKHYYKNLDKKTEEVTLINEASGIASTAFGEGNKALGEASLAFGLNTQAGTDTAGQQSVAFGEGTRALGGRSLAFGERTLASFTNSVAFGADTQARSNGATAFGSRTRALSQYSTAMGNRAVAAGNYAVAFGTDTIAGVKTDESGALTLINDTKIDSNGNIAYVDGQGKTYAVHDYSVNDGETHDYVVVTGTDGKPYIQDYRGNIHAVTIDDKGVATASTEGANVTLNVAGPTSSAGYTLKAYDNATAFGQQTKATNKNATAFGENSEASGEASTAFGIGSKAEGKNSLAALGGLAANDNSIAIGEGTKANNTDKAVSVAIGQNAEASGERSLAIGFGVSEKVNDKDDKTLTSTKASGESAIAIGTDVVAKGQHSVAMGSHTDVAKDSSVAIGFDTHTVSDSAVAIGSGTRAEGRYSVALGLSSVAGKETNDAKNPLDGGGSIAIGYGTSAEASRSVAIGTGATAADAEFTTALGDSANAQQRGSVAIGAGSVATRAAGNKEGGTEYKEAYLIPDVSQATEAEKATWTSTEGAVSVGGTAKYQEYDENGNKVPKTKLLTRQITNVAAGSLDTDAVNVAQLKKMAAKGLDFQGNNTDVTVHRDLGQKLTIKGEGTKEDTNYSGENLKVIGDADGSLTIKMDKDIKGNSVTVGEKGEPGKDGVDGTIGVNGKDGSSVVINGKDGTIGLKGKDGTNGLTIRGAAGKPGVDGKDGITRIVYKDAAGKNHPVATLEDGLKFKGDTGDVISKKLNDTLTIKGGQTDPSKLSTGKNVGVVNEKGALRIELAKKIDLGEKGSVKTGDTIINNNGLTIKNGPTITKTNVSMNNQQIHNVAAGKKGTDAVNVDQLNEVQTLASQHTKVTVEGGTAPKGTTYVGKNLKINVTDNKGQKTYDLKLADNLSIGEKGADGKDGKIGVNGKDGSSVVINGKDGTIGLNGKDGTNGLTIRGAAGKPGVDGKDGITRIVYKDAAGKDHPVATLDDGLNFKGDDGTVISKKLNQRMDIVGGANKNNLSENNIGVISDNGKLHVKLAKDLKDLTSVTTTDGKGNTTVQNGKGVTVKDSQNNTSTFTAKDITFTNRGKSHKTKLDEDGLTIFTKGASGQANQTIKITNTYISMGGQQIHNVAAGKADTDAVNVSQLKAVQSVAEAHSTVSVGGKKAGKDSVDVKGGNLVLKRTENTNGSKNYDVKLADDISIKSVTTTDDKGNKTVQKGGGITTIDKDGNKTSVTGKGVTTVDKDGNKTSLTGKGMTTVDKEGNKTNVTGKGVSISGKDGNKTTITEKGLTIKDGPVVTKDTFSAGGQQIHDVQAGTADTDAVNVSQLKDEIGKVEQHHTEVTVNGGTEAQEGTYNTSGNLQIKKTTEKDTGKKTYDLKLADNLTFGAKDGADGSIGVNGKNGSAVVINGKDGSIGLNGADGKNGLTIKGADGTVGVDGKAGTTRLIYETKDGETTVKHEVATMDDGMKYSGDSGNAAVKLNKNVQIYGGATEYADGNNIGVVASQDGDNAKLQVKLAKDLKGINSIEAKTITTGNTTINNNGLSIKTGDENRNITVQDGNVNMGGNQIHNVAPGQAPGDAVNVSQLNATNSAVNKLGTRVDRVGAGSAALAALHPLDFDPDDKWDFAAGYGHYRGANAAAVGAYYRPNEDTMFSIGGSFGGGENMFNAGVSIKLGQGNHISTSRVAMAKEMEAMRRHMAEQDALIAKLESMHGMAEGPEKSALFPDVAENHWAYQYVTVLAKKGLLEGYPDGEFKGDRMMTRYEFAAIVYRIVESGAGSMDPELSKLVKEFSPELQYIRIDTIHRDDNGQPTVQRVRVKDRK